LWSRRAANGHEFFFRRAGVDGTADACGTSDVHVHEPVVHDDHLLRRPTDDSAAILGRASAAARTVASSAAAATLDRSRIHIVGK
jgi:hypothetical protein